MADRFYTPDPLAPGEYTLTGSEAHHLASVRRFVAGDRVTLFNGDGNDYPAVVLGSGKKSVSLTVLGVEPTARELPFPLVVASALPKGDRADFLIEKLTELGVTRFVPLITARSVVQPKEAAVEKFTRAAIEASKQCGRNRIMTVDTPRTWAAFLKLPDIPERRFVLHTDLATTGRLVTGACVVAVGPEGGFAPEEVNAAGAAGWVAASLGPRVMRVETAAVAAAVVVSGVGQ
ncbi:16s rrna methyltransferase : Ribosomal RNA small subunit methyltransferase E OS=Singulisphaera acidiphila (strain ATCC BAA-1392 / DSM 18658 / VKM B-2454 / MOB10) GN=Sinac_1541 PE=3 SV=1: Methyltrans_RNA [Gemmataceae bacterium]|nr:16s rrna methyltransferase : Ribosomal RNA small subunit methyltransferase E OS=Singulisphaera acidiphila (strain ATCC BAA-1392 / DSM 18658 / VKM B-2454 / MOB10) GN=Sinac_1541 PE=3 SV=1: Methyltrans_RNA [Gemmataceae bacterium]VTT99327.1 16s rrna methyltransferase : Ribosomal RNA small subunit methyltransferase E OS=Singulisphaera acidiphila (strain ATCC BAA-1392 / DSM 18658 / VKM B-2454 / MOB10) GN=Sinac_1541 PE=3 SV=1: Methyltrans_RNA [Gemmataceae bacterium]